MYGIEIRSKNGAPYAISDAAPFTLHKKVTTTLTRVNAGDYRSKLSFPEIPTDCAVYPFFSYVVPNITNGFQVCTIENGVWTVEMSNTVACDVELYLFVERTLTPSTAKYGVQIFDDKGRLIIDMNSKPLKIYLGAVGYTHSSRIAVPAARLTFVKSAGTPTASSKTVAMAADNKIVELVYGVFDAYETTAVVNYRNTTTPYIVCSEY